MKTLYKLNREALRDGDILHVQTSTLFGRTIRKVLSSKEDPCWGSHDALAAKAIDQWHSLDAAPLRCHTTPLSELERKLNAGTVKLKVYRVRDASQLEARMAVSYWMRHVCFTFYDFLAFPRLLFKAVIADVFNTKCGAEWANWCTEGCSDSWTCATGRNVWRKKNPTPLTTEHRAADGELDDITDQVVIVTNPA